MSDRRELARAMRRLGITQAEVARSIGRHQSSISSCLAGRFKSRPILAAIEAAIKEKGAPDAPHHSDPAGPPGDPHPAA